MAGQEIPLHPVFARRSVDRAVVCGACSHAVAERNGDLLRFPGDSFASCRGWRWSGSSQAKGGYWQMAGSGSKQPPLGEQLDVLPAVIECPFCGVPNLFEPKQLNVTASQSSARLERRNRRSKLAPDDERTALIPPRLQAAD